MLISKYDATNNNEEIRILENKYNFTFPEQYRRFLEKYNGGETPNTSFKLHKISSDICGFYGFGKADKNYNYQLLERDFDFVEWLEDGMIPIAKNVFGDYIMLGIKSIKKGRVYFYYHDRNKKYMELADSFENFISKCKSKKIGYIRTIEERRKDMIKLGKENKITPEKLAGWQAEIDEYKNIHQEEVVLE